MKYKATIVRNVLVEEVYEIEVPDSIVAEMMNMDGELDESQMFDYIYGEMDKPSYINIVKDLDLVDWEVEKVEEKIEEKPKPRVNSICI